MNNKIEEILDHIEELKSSEGDLRLSPDELKQVYIALNRPKVNLIKVDETVYVSFESAKKIQFIITDTNSIDKFSFIEQFNKKLDVTSKEKNYWEFLEMEFFQGKNILHRVWRFVVTIFPVIIFNCLALLFASNANINSFMQGLLTAITVFVAIFSLFTVSHEHMERKKKLLFENGKLAYLFSVDKNITISGVIAIVFSLFTLLLIDENSERFYQNLYLVDIKKVLFLMFGNISFLLTWIVLRSIIEFYIIRPARFILGDIKKQSLEDFE
jgi:hypothetical protein